MSAVALDPLLTFLIGACLAIYLSLAGLRFTAWAKLHLDWLWLAADRSASPPMHRTVAASLSTEQPAHVPHDQAARVGVFARPLLCTQCVCGADTLCWTTLFAGVAVCLSCERAIAVSGDCGGLMDLRFLPAFRRWTWLRVGGET